jgi:membrane protein required for colicin V production
MTAGVIPPLTSWDWFIITVACISTGLGVWRGLIRTVFGLAAWILGLVGAPLVGIVIGERLGISSGIPMWVMYVIAFLATFIVVRLVGALFLKGARSVGLAGVDRMLGAALGMARAALVVLIVAVVAHRLGFAQTASWQAAASRPLLDTMVEVAQPWLPPVKKA